MHVAFCIYMRIVPLRYFGFHNISSIALERAEIPKNLISVYTGQHKSLSVYNSLQNQFFTPQRIHMIIFCEEKVYNGKQQFTKVS